MSLIDSHAHLDLYTETPDALPSVLTRARAAGVETILAIGIGEGPETMHQALEIARQNEGIYASAGIHPQEAAHATPEALAKLAALAADPKCIAVGEIGLDYYHVENPLPPVQHEAFVAQMKIAAAVRKPILIHCRTSELATPAAKERFEQHGNPEAAWDDLLALIAEHWTPHGIGGIMHCFSGSAEQARLSAEAGFYLSFAGNLTYPKSVSIREAAVQAPAERAGPGGPYGGGTGLAARHLTGGACSAYDWEFSAVVPDDDSEATGLNPGYRWVKANEAIKRQNTGA